MKLQLMIGIMCGSFSSILNFPVVFAETDPLLSNSILDGEESGLTEGPALEEGAGGSGERGPRDILQTGSQARQNVGSSHEEKKMPQSIKLKDKGRFRATLSVATLWNNYELQGTGFNAKLPNKLAVGHGISLGYLSESGKNGGYFERKSFQTKYEGLTTIAPNQIKATRTRYLLEYRYFPWADFSNNFENLGFLVGFTHSERNSTRTQPNQLIGNFNALGPSLGILNRWPFGSSSGIEFYGRAIFFNYYQEESVFSGFRRVAAQYELASKYFYCFSSRFTVHLGVELSRVSAGFEGAGTRGTTGAEESEWTLAFPLEIGVVF